MLTRLGLLALSIVSASMLLARSADAQTSTATASIASSTVAVPMAAESAPSMARVRFESARPGVVLHVAEGDKLELLCTAPCETSLLPGDVSLSLSMGGDPVAVATPVVVADGQRLVGDYRSRRGLRIGLGLAGGAALVGGGVMMVADNVDGAGSAEVTLAGVFTAVAGAVLLGLTEAFPDQATVDVSAQ